MWLTLVGVYLLPAVAWQVEQLVTPVWFISVPGPHKVPMAWQVPQLVLVIGATVCGVCDAAVGVPATGTACPAVL